MRARRSRPTDRRLDAPGRPGRPGRLAGGRGGRRLGWLAGGRPRGRARGLAEARDAGDDRGRHQGARLPRRQAGRRRLVDHRRRPGVPGRDVRAWRAPPCWRTATRRRGGNTRKNVQGAVEYLVRCTTPNGLITGPSQDSGMPMHGHGFALMFLASVYGMIAKESLRQQVGRRSARRSRLTSQGQSGAGGWTYIPGGGRRRVGHGHPGPGAAGAHNAGFLVPRAVIEEAVKLPRECRTPEAESDIRSAPAAARGCRSRRPPSPPSTTPASSTARSRPTASSTSGTSSAPARSGTRGAATPSTPTSTPRRASTWRATHTGTPTSPRPATSSSPCRARRVVERRRDRPGLRHRDRRHHLAVAVQVSSGLPALSEGRDLTSSTTTEELDLAELRGAAIGPRPDPRADREPDRRPGRGRRAAPDRRLRPGAIASSRGCRGWPRP